MRFALLTLAALLSTACAVPAAATADDSGAEEESLPKVVRMSMLVPAVRRPLHLLGFSWNDCGGAGAWVKVKSVSVQPDPVSLNGKITVAVAFTAAHTFGDGQPLATSVVMKKKFLGSWIKLPCIDNVGSCNYGDLCTVQPPPASCPAEFVKAKVPCKCPVPAGNYTLPGYTFSVDASKIPKFLESGDYQASVNVNSGGSQVLCANAELSLS